MPLNIYVDFWYNKCKGKRKHTAKMKRKFSLGKRKCGMGLVTAKLEETAAHVVALSILLLNLRKIQQQNGQGNHMLICFYQLRCHQSHYIFPLSQTEFAFHFCGVLAFSLAFIIPEIDVYV